MYTFSCSQNTIFLECLMHHSSTKEKHTQENNKFILKKCFLIYTCTEIMELTSSSLQVDSLHIEMTVFFKNLTTM